MQQTQDSGILHGRAAPGWQDELRSRTVVDLLELRNDSKGAFVYLDERGEPTNLTWGDVSRNAFRYARLLRERGIREGDRVMIMLPTRPEYLYVFFGIQAAGAIPVPVYPPFNLKQLKQFLATLTGVINDCGASALIYWSKVKPILGSALAGARVSPTPIALEELIESNGKGDGFRASLDPDRTALIQYTSGSTDAPKGVELSHRNLLHNVHHIDRALDLDPEKDRCVSWLPLYHDMGLIGTLMGALYSHVDLVLMAPQTFLMRPRLWLKAISDYDATITVAPNFAYNICATRVSEKAAAELDLSSLRVAMCGAEPIQIDTFEAFQKRFAGNGLRANVFLPVYGLAESTVATTFPPIHEEPTVIWLDRDVLETEGRAEIVDREKARSVAAFGVGAPFPESAVQIWDDEAEAVVENGTIGEIRIRGPSVMKGYFRNPQATESVSSGGWLRTGDLGFVRDGHLFITGRAKDLIIRYGRNYYPQDIEAVAERVDGVRKGCVIAFGYFHEERQTEEACLLAESRITDPEKLEVLRQEIRDELQKALAFAPDRIELLPPRTLLKTSSGKLRRRPTRERFLAGTLAPSEDSWLDRIRLLAGSSLHWAGHGIRRLFRR